MEYSLRAKARNLGSTVLCSIATRYLRDGAKGVKKDGDTISGYILSYARKLVEALVVD